MGELPMMVKDFDSFMGDVRQLSSFFDTNTPLRPAAAWDNSGN
jgi:hypothetical protein